ncbi:MAG: aldehyde ferredoxin oxidoreductase family protein [Deltaproteobacteria bacterium]|nr:aldehyde ferredoxin oxidoreductase family protein [Deltaproteobacteria bacterium]
MSTFAGKLLRINLSASTFKEEEIPSRHLEKYLSARGLGSKYLYDEIAPGIDPLGPRNKLIMSIGVLGCTGIQGFSKWAVSSKSPLTGTIFRSIAGGNFGPWMKHAGYDLMIIEGAAEKATYLFIDESGPRFMDARDLAGLDTRRTQLLLKKRHGPGTESACIGPAGEKGIRYAVIASGERTASRGGLGTVMGAKNLKAVAIKVPAKRYVPHDADRFRILLEKQIEILKRHPRRENMNTLGTPYITTVVDNLGILPVRNFQEGSIENIEEISGQKFFRLKKAKAGCYLCMTRCGGMRDVATGPLEGTRIDGPEYESIYAFGPLLGITDKSFIIDANALCDYYGIDTISTGVCLAFAFELFERGILTPLQTGGLTLTWGDRRAAFTLIERIGKGEGIGQILGQGVLRAAVELGEGAEPFAMHIKGLELPGYDPRGVKGYALSMATSNIGGSHMYGRPRDELSGKVDPYTEKGKGADIARVQMEQAVEDSLIACTFGNTGLNLEMYAEYLEAATGLESLGDPENLLRAGERILCIERCFNVREGFRRRDDTLPERMTAEPLKNAGPATGQRVENLEGLLDEYYRDLGYTREGIPSKERLEALGIPEVADMEKAL